MRLLDGFHQRTASTRLLDSRSCPGLDSIPRFCRPARHGSELMFGHGVSIWNSAIRGSRRGVTGTSIRLSALAIPESALIGDVVATISVSGSATGTPIFTLEDDAE